MKLILKFEWKLFFQDNSFWNSPLQFVLLLIFMIVSHFVLNSIWNKLFPKKLPFNVNSTSNNNEQVPKKQFTTNPSNLPSENLVKLSSSEDLSKSPSKQITSSNTTPGNLSNLTQPSPEQFSKISMEIPLEAKTDLHNPSSSFILKNIPNNNSIEVSSFPSTEVYFTGSVVLPISPRTKSNRVGIRLRTSANFVSLSDQFFSFSNEEGGSIIQNKSEINYQSPSSRMIFNWVTKPKTVLIVKKWKDEQITRCLEEVAKWLHKEHNLRIIVEHDTHEELPHWESFEDVTTLNEIIDFIITLGGDGTVLHVNSLFQESVPPIISFNLGSMGFLTPFNFKNFKEKLEYVLRGQCYIVLRHRLKCAILKNKTLVKEIHVLNETTIDRGNSSFLSNLECYCDGQLVTSVQADGIIIATATGSTAYSLSSGGSLVQPQLPAILVTPICPHSLTFRPVVLPSTVKLKIRISSTSHCSTSAAFDGRNHFELEPGDSIELTISKWPVPTISGHDQTLEWFESISNRLNWNRMKSNIKFRTNST